MHKGHPNKRSLTKHTRSIPQNSKNISAAAFVQKYPRKICIEGEREELVETRWSSTWKLSVRAEAYRGISGACTHRGYRDITALSRLTSSSDITQPRSLREKDNLILISRRERAVGSEEKAGGETVKRYQRRYREPTIPISWYHRSWTATL